MPNVTMKIRSGLVQSPFPKAASIRHDLGDKEIAAQTKERRALWEADIRTIKERHALERKARARGERVPSIHDPEAYVVWLQRQRVLPWDELARDLNKQSQ
jgi:hypothetical protein